MTGPEGRLKISAPRIGRRRVFEWDGACPRLPSDMIEVLPGSPVRHRRAVYKLSVYFQREFHYDFTQYGCDGNEEDPDSRAYLWLSEDMSRSLKTFEVAFGACSFRKRGPDWAMQWAWIHPFERRRGHLSRAWASFESRFGKFNVEAPLSDAMAGFIKKARP